MQREGVGQGGATVVTNTGRTHDMHVPASSVSLIVKGVEFVRAHFSSKQRNRVRLQQIRHEVEVCLNVALEVHQTWHKMPTAQLPHVVWDQFGYELHSAGVLVIEELNALSAFFTCCAQINSAVQTAGTVDVYSSNRLAGVLIFRPAQLSKRLLLPRDGKLSLYDAAQAAISSAISRLT
jgi:hypothetical protein